MSTIFTDKDVFKQIKDKSRKAYIKCWKEFRDLHPTINFETSPPGEEALIAYFKHLREEKNVATTSMWTFYSYINSIIKRKYGEKLQSFPRLTMFIKGFDVDTKQKVDIFYKAVIKKFMVTTVDSAYWEVRQAIVIVAYFGGLRMVKTMDLKLEMIIRGPKG